MRQISPGEYEDVGAFRHERLSVQKRRHAVADEKRPWNNGLALVIAVARGEALAGSKPRVLGRPDYFLLLLPVPSRERGVEDL